MSTQRRRWTLDPRSLTRCVLTFVALGVCGLPPSQDASAQKAEERAPQNSVPIDEVTISALKQIDRATLIQVVIPNFVKAHGAPSERIGQLGRWHEDVCPETVGLRGPADEFVSRRVLEAARRVGAPTKRTGKCKTNVNIIFSSKPQQQMDYMASKDPHLAGYSAQQGDLFHVSHPIQAWYVTGTRSFVTVDSPVNMNPSSDAGDTAAARPSGSPSTAGGLQIDSPNSAVIGRAGSLLGDEDRSEFARVTVIVDANTVVRYPLQAVADYIAMLVLTRTTLDGCNPLPSIIDLLSADCGERSKPDSITEADVAYLKALYTSNLELKLNLERGEVQQRMVHSIEALYGN